MKNAKIPSTVADAARKTMSQKLSCASGQWYFFRRSTTTTSVIASGVSRPKTIREGGHGVGRLVAQSVEFVGDGVCEEICSSRRALIRGHGA